MVRGQLVISCNDIAERATQSWSCALKPDQIRLMSCRSSDEFNTGDTCSCELVELSANVWDAGKRKPGFVRNGGGRS